MSSPISESMHQLLDRFDDAWNGPTPPRIENYLASCPPRQRLTLLVELVRIDLERRLTRGEHIRLEETYLPRFPELSSDRASVVALAAQEFELRRKREPNLSPAEYFERLPQYREELARLLSSYPTLNTRDGETMEKKAPVDSCQTIGETRDNFGFLTPPQAADEIGRLAHYRILKVLGEGGMGVVFLAEDTRLGRTVALKTMKPEIAADPQHRQRFLREARAAAKVEHDHIVPIYGVGEDNGVPWLAMPLLKGESLDALLKRWKVLKPAQAVRLGIHVAKGLAAAHAAGLIHRDVKPGNIWIEPEDGGRAKLLDFGLARDLVPQGGKGNR